MDLEKYKQDFATLMEAGFVAVNQYDEDAATKLFKAAELLSPSHPFPKIGFGYMHLCKLELTQAAKMFNDVLAKEPANDMAKAFLGLTLSFNPKEVSKGETVLKEVGKTTKDPLIKDLTKSAIDFVEKFVKKAPSPAQVQAPKQ